LLYLPRRKI